MASAGAVLLEARPFRPFKSSEEYLYAMKEDLAEWLTVLYPELRITPDNFLDRLDTGVVLCRHANAVRESARLLLSSSEAPAGAEEGARTLAQGLVARAPLQLLAAARAGTFFARDNVSNFIAWCRRALGVLECLLFETDDLILRKNEKHVVLCLLEVARRGAVLGMPAPLLVQMERQIERELAGEEGAGAGGGAEGALGLVPEPARAQLVTNDLRSLDERVRDALARCTCPTQFPMVRVSEGKYRIGDTKLLIFVRILRSHVMVRVGGGWDTLEHYLDKHDPCRCRAQHRATLQGRLVHNRAPAPYGALASAQVHYERSQPASLPPILDSCAPRSLCSSQTPRRASPSPSRAAVPFANPNSPSPSRTPVAALAIPRSPPSARRSRSPARALSATRQVGVVPSPHLIPLPHSTRAVSPAPPLPTVAPPSENASDNGSEVSDEGYRSLGLVPASNGGSPLSNGAAVTLATITNHRHSLDSQNSTEDAELNERLELEGCQTEDCGADEYVSLTTGLRKTNYSDAFYGAGGRKQDDVPSTTSSRNASHNASPEPIVSCENNHSPSESLRAATRIPHRSPARSLKNYSPSNSPVRCNGQSLSNGSSPVHAAAASPRRAAKVTPSPRSSPARPPPAARNTWNGRVAPGQRPQKSRPALNANTFASPIKTALKKEAADNTSNFRRNSPLRASASALGRSKQHPRSPLLEQILKSAETAQDDATVLKKMRAIIRQYSNEEPNIAESDTASSKSKESEYGDFTSAWVMSEGKLERSTSVRHLAAPRPERGHSRIPAPLTRTCIRSTSTQFQ